MLEIDAMAHEMRHGMYARRNVALFWLGLWTGFRISELLSIRLEQLYPNGHMAASLTVQRQHMKKKRQSRTMPLPPDAQDRLSPWLSDLQRFGYLQKTDYVFQNATHRNEPITRTHAYEIINQAARAAGVQGRIGTHSMRKTFADRLYTLLLERQAAGEPIDPLRQVSKALGHKSIDTTDKYLSFRQETMQEAIPHLYGD